MDLNRRSLLKFFGAGASVVPLIGGEVVRAAEARLIEPPKVELAQAVTVKPFGQLPADDDQIGKSELVVIYRANGNEYTFHAHGFTIEAINEYGLLDLSPLPERQNFLNHRRIKWRINGECVADPGGVLYTMSLREGQPAQIAYMRR